MDKLNKLHKDIQPKSKLDKMHGKLPTKEESLSKIDLLYEGIQEALKAGDTLTIRTDKSIEDELTKKNIMVRKGDVYTYLGRKKSTFSPSLWDYILKGPNGKKVLLNQNPINQVALWKRK